VRIYKGNRTSFVCHSAAFYVLFIGRAISIIVFHTHCTIFAMIEEHFVRLLHHHLSPFSSQLPSPPP
jgi:hypothetical protein